VNEQRKAHREIEHTADLGIEVEAEELFTLFASAGEALYGLIADPAGFATKQTIAVSATGDGWDELLHAWLSELLAQFNLKGFVGKECEVKKIDARRVEGEVKGESLDLKRHRFYTEIKGVTYHDLKVWQESGVWHARVIFDV
jgi:SHS2 domain-containing protein